MQGFKRERQQWLPHTQGKPLASLYFGGGTPFLLGPERIAEIVSWEKSPIEEITLEANPEGITPALMRAYKDAGINRVSIGLQTLDDALLKGLGRSHTAKNAIEAVEITAASGISNISIDLMYDIPYQTLASWQQTLERLRELPIAHLSLYNLTFEPHTVFFKKRGQLLPSVPDPEASLQMYLRAVDTLEAIGLKQYEISAFARSGCHSRHNVGYWTARPFLGFGPSAFSYWKGRRFRNVANLKSYCQALEGGHSPADFSEELDPSAKYRELLAVQLRLVEGVDLMAFGALHGPIDPALEKTLEHLASQGFLETGEQLRLTPRGRLFYDTVATEIV